MARSQTASTPAPPKPHRTARGAAKKIEEKKMAEKTETVVAPEFSPAEHHEEIAVAAYLASLDGGGSPEENWLKAETEVRGRYQ